MIEKIKKEDGKMMHSNELVDKINEIIVHLNKIQMSDLEFNKSINKLITKDMLTHIK